MTTPRSRKPPQHDTANKSKAQLSEYIYELGWEIDQIIGDYGEDFTVRIFAQGNFTGETFYLQLKGTKDLKSHMLKSGDLTYEVDVVNLLQWYRNQLPVVFVLWDTENRVGYWLHIQPYVENKLKQNATWLNDEDGMRNIRISLEHTLKADMDQVFLATIAQECRKITVGRQLLEKLALQAKPSELQLAMKYYDLHDYERAMAAITKAKSLGVSGPQYAMIHGSILTEYYIAQGSTRKSLLREAIALFKEAREQMKPSEVVYVDYNIGNALDALREYSEAIQYFDTALATNPPNELAAQIWKNRGTAYYHLGDYNEEFASYQKALELDPNRWEAYVSWATTEAFLKNYARAKELYLSALRVYPKLAERYPRHIYGLAFACWKLKEPALSYEYANHVLSVKPDDERALKLKKNLLIFLWHKDKQYIPDALIFFRAWLEDEPTDIFVRRQLYLLYHAQSGQELASRLAAEAILKTDAPPDALYNYACILADEEKIPEAIEILEKALQQNQEHTIVHKLADLKKQVGKHDEAIRLYKLAFADNELRLLQNVADCFFLLKQYENCVWCCARAIQLDPQQNAWWNNLVCALMLLERGVCAAFVEQLRVSFMETFTAETSLESASIYIEKFIEILREDFGNIFAESILTPLSPF